MNKWVKWTINLFSSYNGVEIKNSPKKPQCNPCKINEKFKKAKDGDLIEVPVTCLHCRRIKDEFDEQTKKCTHNWEWQLGENATSWIRCTKCGKSMFGEDIGVILINWKKTNEDYNLADVLASNIHNDGVVIAGLNRNGKPIMRVDESKQ